LCTHRARYKKVEDTTWTWLPAVNTDPEGTDFAYAELPVEGLDAGTYQFYFDVRDCAGQRTYAPKIYYFKVAHLH
jgi:5-hydroxyisourate hydrolase-like protein (transthyretin family)